MFIFYIQKFYSNTFYILDTVSGSKLKKNPCFNFTDYLLVELDINQIII